MKQPTRVEVIADTNTWVGYCQQCSSHRVIGTKPFVLDANGDHVYVQHHEMWQLALDAASYRRRRAMAA